MIRRDIVLFRDGKNLAQVFVNDRECLESLLLAVLRSAHDSAGVDDKIGSIQDPSITKKVAVADGFQLIVGGAGDYFAFELGDRTVVDNAAEGAGEKISHSTP